MKQIFVRNYSSAVHTLKVAEQIKKRRQAALLGGGEKRIEAQHKKVWLKRMKAGVVIVEFIR